MTSAAIRLFLLIKNNNTFNSNIMNNKNKINSINSINKLNKIMKRTILSSINRINNINKINFINKQIKIININKLGSIYNINKLSNINNINRINTKNTIIKNNINNKKNNINNKKNNKIDTQPKKKIYNVIIKKINPKYLNHKVITTNLGLSNIVDLRSKFPPVFNQGMLGSCTSNALCALVAFDDPELIGSRLFLYYNERMLKNSTLSDSGALISDGIKCLIDYGVCAETDWPYDIQQFAVKPPDVCYTNALLHQALQVSNIRNDLNSMKNALVNNNPFAVGISIYSSFETQSVANNGIVPMPTINDKLLGGHAIVCVGYNDAKKNWIMRNSWGALWGDKGYFYLPYAYLLDSSLATDLWCVNKME